jgi:hypothetical protein
MSGFGRMARSRTYYRKSPASCQFSPARNRHRFVGAGGRPGAKTVLGREPASSLAMTPYLL